MPVADARGRTRDGGEAARPARRRGALTARSEFPARRLRPDETAHVFEDRTTTFGELDLRTSRIADGLLGPGVRPQARVDYMGMNSDLFFEAFHCCFKANAVLVGVNWSLAPPEIVHVLNDAGAEVLFVAVIGVPDEKWGEAVKACVVLKPGVTASADDLVAFTKRRIASYKCPKTVDFL